MDSARDLAFAGDDGFTGVGVLEPSGRRSTISRKDSMEIKFDALRELRASEARMERFCADPNFPKEWGRATAAAAAGSPGAVGHNYEVMDNASVNSAGSHSLQPSSTSGSSSSYLTTDIAPAYWHRLALRSSTPDTAPNELVRRSAFMLMSSLTCGAGLIWAHRKRREAA